MLFKLPCFGFIAALLSLSAAPLLAAPPIVNALFPAGGQRGKTVSVTVDGVFPRWPVGVWVDGEDVDVRPSKEKSKLEITISADAIPGVYAIRLYDDDGASVARP